MRRTPPLSVRSEVPVEWFLVRVTAKTGSGATAQYQYVEISLDGAGAFSDDARGRSGTALNYGSSAGAELAVGDRALCRTADGAAGLKSELVPFVLTAGGSGGDAHYLAPVYCATTGPVALATDLEAGDTLDGVTLAAGMRILVKDQASPAENGVRVVAASGIPPRAPDADTAAELSGALVPVRFGATNANAVWLGGTTAGADPVGFGDQLWVRVGPVGSGTAYYLPIWTDTDALGDSVAYFDSGSGSANHFYLPSSLMVLGQASTNSVMRLYGNYAVCQFPSTGSGPWLDGLSGVIGPGAEATGGIVTDLGSGSYVGTASVNAFTNQNSFQPLTAATVPLTVQGAASQAANLTEWKNSGGTVLASVSAAGALSAGAISGTTGTFSGAVSGSSLSGTYDAGTW